MKPNRARAREGSRTVFALPRAVFAPLLLGVLLLPRLPLGAEPLSRALAEELAVSRSGMAAIKDLEVKRAEAALAEAKAMRGPKASLTASASYLANPPEGIVIRQGDLGIGPVPGSEFPVSYPSEDYVIIEDAKNSYFKLSLNASIPVFTWGKLERGVEIARASLQAAIDARAGGLSDARADTSKAYLAAVFARSSSAIVAETVSVLTDILASDKSSFDEGDITLQVLLESRSNLSRARTGEVKANEGLSSALAALAFLTGRDAVAAADIADGFEAFIGTENTAIETEEENALVERAISASRELKDLESKARMARLYAEVQKANGLFRPNIQLQAAADVAGQDVPLLGNWTDTWDTGLVITLAGQLPLYDSGESEAKASQALSQSEAARRGAEELKRSLPLRTRRAMEASRNARAVLAENEDALALAREQEKNARVSRENELLTRKEELGAEAARLQAELSLELSRFELGNALIELERLCPLD
jgi:outer membrane protein